MAEKTLFQVFNVPREGFTADLLREGYHRIIRRVHPDKVKLGSGEAAQFINGAYRTLSNDYTRSIYEYSLDNRKNLVQRTLPPGVLGSTGEEVTVLDLEKERVGCDKGLVEMEFLDRILGLEDEIESAAEKDLEQIKTLIKKEVEGCKKSKGDARALARWRYYNRLLGIIAQKEMIE